MAKGGALHVTLVSATLLPATRCGSEADPADSYATLNCGKHQFTTRTAKDQGTLPTWNETHSFELEDHYDIGSQELVIEIFAARSGLNELLGVAKLPLSKIITANEETSLHPLNLPHEGECGQVKVTLKWESQVATTTNESAAMYGGYEQMQPSTPMHSPGPTQPSAPAYPYRSASFSHPHRADGNPPAEPYPYRSTSFTNRDGANINSTADAAASALAGLALNKDKQYGPEYDQTSYQNGSAAPFKHQQVEHQSSQPAYPPVPDKRETNSTVQTGFGGYSSDTSTYPPNSPQTSGQYPPQGLPYLASPIRGVVTGMNYTSPSSSYTHPPLEVSSKVKESESVAQQYGLPATAYPESYHHIQPPSSGDPPADINKDKVNPPMFTTPYYSAPPVSQAESYPPAFQSYAANPGSQGYEGYGAPSSGTYPPPAPSYPPSSNPSNKTQQAAHQETGGNPVQYSAATYTGGYQPDSNVVYPPNSPYPPPPSQYEHIAPPSGYPGEQNAEQGKEKVKAAMDASSQGSSEGGTHEKGYHGHQYGHAADAYAQPFYPPAAYPPYGYAPPVHGYQPQAYPPQYAPQYVAPGYGAPYPQHGHAPTGYMATPFGGSHGPQVGYGVPTPYPGHHQQHGHYRPHHGGHGGHGGHKFKGHKGGHGYGQHGYGGHKGGHGYGGHGYGHAPHYGHHGGHHSHHSHHKYKH